MTGHCIRMTLITALTAILIAATALTPPARAASSSCPRPPLGNSGPRNDPSAFIGRIKVQNVSCAVAKAAIRAGRLNTTHGLVTRAFSCRALHTTPGGQGGGIANQTIRCAHRAKVFQFFWSTY